MMSSSNFQKCLNHLKEFLNGNDQAIENVFKLIDCDSSNKIDFTEMKAFLEQESGQSVEGQEVFDLIKQADGNGDGKIDAKEFKNFALAKRKEKKK